jgi:hypothetical protein
LLIEFLDVFDPGGIQIVKVAIKIMCVRIGVERFSGKVDCEKQAIGPIQYVDAYLFFDYVALVLQIFRGKIEGLEAVGLDPKYWIERRNRRGFNIFGVVVAGVAVVISSPTFDHAVQNAFRSVRGTFKHHVLEQMSEPGATLRFQTKPDAIADA